MPRSGRPSWKRMVWRDIMLEWRASVTRADQQVRYVGGAAPGLLVHTNSMDELLGLVWVESKQRRLTLVASQRCLSRRRLPVNAYLDFINMTGMNDDVSKVVTSKTSLFTDT